MLMVDADFNETVHTNTVLHTIDGNLSAPSTSPSATRPVQLSAAPEPLAPYIGPQPPKGKASHNYTIMIFEQPKNFSVPADFSSFIPLNLSDVYTRTNFPVVDFAKAVGLGQPLAATYFRLDLANGTAAGGNSSSGAGNASVTTGSPSATGTSASGSGAGAGSGSSGSTASGTGAAASQTAASGNGAVSLSVGMASGVVGLAVFLLAL